jgi:muramoyltetrapeptide carboxypeptidase LdcA involved in peptidoglycan recycling
VKKHIYIYSPSSAVRDKASFKRGIARLKTLGHEVEVDESATSASLGTTKPDWRPFTEPLRAVQTLH